MSKSKYIRIFISSTFCDMDAERDIILSEVYHILRKKLEPKGIHVKFTDLRWGVNTRDIPEEQREYEVLSECLNEIRKARPFFVGLLGGRYGWQPGEEKWKEISSTLTDSDSDLIIQSLDGKNSVTEFEILAGALCSSNSLPRSVFCFRDDEVYSRIPSDVRGKYLDTEPLKIERLQRLKGIVSNMLSQNHLNNNLINYSCSWDGEKLVVQNDFAQNLADTLVKIILAYESSDKELMKPSETDQILSDQLKLIEQNTRLFVGRNEELKYFHQYIQDKKPPLIIKSRTGFGKTSIICKLISDYDKLEDFIVLFHLSNVRGNFTSGANILSFWLSQIDSEAHKNLSGEEDYEKLAGIFLESSAKYRDKKFLFFIDNFENLGDSFILSDKKWLPQNASLFVVWNDNNSSYLGNFEGVNLINLPPLTLQDTELMIKTILLDENKKLSQNLVTKLLEKKADGKVNSASIPLWTIMMVKRLTSLNLQDYKELREIEGVAEDEKIDIYLANIIDKAEFLPEPLFLNFILSAPLVTSEDYKFCFIFLHFLAASEFGLRIDDIMALTSSFYDELRMRKIIQWLYPLIVETDDGVISFSYPNFREIMSFPAFREIMSFPADGNEFSLYQQTLANHFFKILKDNHSDHIALVELPFLFIRLGTGSAISFLLNRFDRRIGKSTKNALIRLLQDKNERPAIEQFVSNALSAKTDEMTEFMLDVGRDLIALKKFADAYFFLSLAVEFFNKSNIAINAENLLFRSMILLQNEDAKESPTIINLANFFIKEFYSIFDSSLNWKEAFALIILLRSREYNRIGNFEMSQDGIFLALDNLEILINRHNRFYLFPYLKETQRILADNLAHLPVDPNQQKMLDFATKVCKPQVWMLKQYAQIHPRLFFAGFLSQIGESEYAKFIYDEAEKLSDELIAKLDSNPDFFEIAIISYLCKIRNADSSYPIDFKYLSGVVDFMRAQPRPNVDLILQCLYVLYCFGYYDNPQDFIKEIYSSIPENFLKSPHNLSVNTTVVQIFCNSADDLQEYINTDADGWLDIVEQLLIYRNDTEKANLVLDFYKNNFSQDLISAEKRLRYQFLVLLTKTRNMTPDNIVDINHEYMPKIEKIESDRMFDIQKYCMVILARMRVMDTNLDFSFLHDVHYVLHSLMQIEVDSHAGAKSALMVEYLYSCFMGMILVYLEIVSQNGRIDMAQELKDWASNIQNEFENLALSGIMVDKGNESFNRAVAYFYEQSGQNEESIYHMGRALNFAEKVLSKREISYFTLRDYACQLDNFSQCYIRLTGRIGDVAQNIFKAYNIFNDLYNQDPQPVADDLCMVANLLISLKHQAEGLKEALEFGEDFLETHDISRNPRSAACLNESMGLLYQEAKLMEEAEAHLVVSYSLFKDMLNLKPTNEMYIRDVAISSLRLVDFYLSADKPLDMAIEKIEEVVPLIMAAREKLPDSYKIGGLLLELLSKKAQLELFGKRNGALETIDILIRNGINYVKRNSDLYMPIFRGNISRLADVAAACGYVDLSKQLNDLKMDYWQN